MFFKILKIHLCVFLLALAGCSTDMEGRGKPLPDVTFGYLQPIPIDVGAIRTHREESPADESFIVSPYEAVGQYMHARFRPKGFKGSLHGKIEEASVNHSYEPSQNRFGRYFDVDGMDAYDMTVILRLEHLDDGGRVLYGTVLTARRKVRVSEHASIAERERKQIEGMESLFKDIDREVKRIVFDDMKISLAE